MAYKFLFLLLDPPHLRQLAAQQMNIYRIRLQTSKLFYKPSRPQDMHFDNHKAYQFFHMRHPFI